MYFPTETYKLSRKIDIENLFFGSPLSYFDKSGPHYIAYKKLFFQYLDSNICGKRSDVYQNLCFDLL